jgi:hypothetical protein
MNNFGSSCICSFRDSELQRFGMRVFISKHELKMIIIKEHQFHNRGNTLLYSRNQLYDITKINGIKF